VERLAQSLADRIADAIAQRLEDPFAQRVREEPKIEFPAGAASLLPLEFS
jgi:hypothetical protein